MQSRMRMASWFVWLMIGASVSTSADPPAVGATPSKAIPSKAADASTGDVPPDAADDRGADHGADDAAMSTSHESLRGAWLLEGNADGSVTGSAGLRKKFFGDGQWCVTEVSALGGQVVLHLGGSYEIANGEYVETVEYAAGTAAGQRGKQFRFRLEVFKDHYIQTGLDNPYHESWVRYQ